jgi:hypothetical protein
MRAPSWPPRLRPRWRWALAGAGLALAVVAIVMLLSIGNPPVSTPGGPGQSAEPRAGEPAFSLAPLASIRALPVRVTREAFEAGSFDEARALGLSAYQGAAYDSAASQLRIALDQKPGDPEVSLYLGSAELLRRNPGAAMPPLETASRAKDPAIQEEALWQLANAWLLANQGDDALAMGRELRARGGVHAIDADSLIGRVERALIHH